MLRTSTLTVVLTLVVNAGTLADPIHDAVVAGDTTTVRQLLNQNPSLTTATDAGVAFLVEVYGLVIFHAPYTDEIDYLASITKPIDLAFMPITGCSLGTPASVREGVIYGLDKLQPTVFFPQHAMNGEYRLREFADGLKEDGYTKQVGCPENGGDCFHYRDHRIL